MCQSIGESIASLDIENVFIYIGDAVRWDYRCQEISEMGSTYRTVSSSIHSPPSFASLITGLHPPSHGIFSFEHRLSDETQTLLNVEEYTTRFVNSVIENGNEADPIFPVLSADPGYSDPFEGLSSPFITIERGPGGHAPYVGAETASEYFRSRRNAVRKVLQSEYRSAIERDADLFKRRLRMLEEQGLRKDTLVVYTSDHGELLGEGGLVGHNAPMRPELVYVPTTFIHPDLPDEGDSRILRHVDLAPTALAAIGERGALGRTDGHVGGSETDPGLTFYKNRILKRRSRKIKLAFDGVWDRNGGQVFARSSQLERLGVLGGKLLKSPKRGYLWRHLPSAVGTYFEGNTTYGDPAIDREQADELLTEARKRSPARDEDADADLSEEAADRLRDLGYI